MRLLSVSLICLVVALLVAIPLAQAAPGTGRLSFSDAPVLDGTLGASGSGEVRAADTATELSGEGQRVHVLRVWYEVEVIHNPIGPVGTDMSEVKKEWRNFTASTFHLDETGERFESLVFDAATVELGATPVKGHQITAYADPLLVADDAGPSERSQDDERRFTYVAAGDRFLTPPGELSANGDFTVYFEDSTFLVRDAAGRIHSFTSGVERSDTSPASHRETYSYHLVYVQSGAVTVSGADTVGWLESPVFGFVGELTASHATGSIEMDGDRFMLDEVPVTVGGSLELHPRPVGEPQPLEDGATHVGTTQSSAGRYAGTASDFDGEVSVLAIGAQIPYVEENDLTVVATVGVMTLVGAVLLLTPKGKWVLLTALTPLYAKTERDRLLDNESRDRIFQAIRNNPGINLSQIHRLSDLGWGVTVYHLKMMEKNGLVFSETSARDKCFFENEPRFRSLRAAIAAIANKEPALKVAQVVAERPGLTQRDVVRESGLTQRTVSYYTGKLARLGLVKTERRGNFVHYHSTDDLVDALRVVVPEGVEVTFAAGGTDTAAVQV